MPVTIVNISGGIINFENVELTLEPGGRKEFKDDTRDTLVVKYPEMAVLCNRRRLHIVELKIKKIKMPKTQKQV